MASLELQISSNFYNLKWLWCILPSIIFISKVKNRVTNFHIHERKNMNTEILLRRRNKVVLNRGEEVVLPLNYVMTLNKNIESLGYTFSIDLISVMRTYSVENIKPIYLYIVKVLKQLVGADVKYTPMYPNFPQQIMEASDAELYFNAIMHYLGDVIGMIIMPEYEVEERLPLLDRPKLKVINLGTREEFLDIFTNLISSKTSLSETDKADIDWFIDNEDVESLLPDQIAHKENLAYLAGSIIKKGGNYSLISKYFKTATDVLRLITALSDGDVSLAKNTKFKKFNRPTRKFLLGLLNSCNNIVEDMYRYKNRWIRVGEILHPGEYKQFDKVILSFDYLRSGKRVETFNSKVEERIEKGNVIGATQLLQSHPGELARRLDKLIRLDNNQIYVIDSFNKVSDNISTPVLLQVMEHFAHRNDSSKLRVFFPKGVVAKAYGMINDLDSINPSYCSKVVDICRSSLIKRFKDLPPLGKVYLDKELRNYIVPFSQRSASKALKTIVRGSHIDIPDGNTVRLFIWWKERPPEEIYPKNSNLYFGYKTRIDIDLSAIAYDENWNYKEHVSYTNLRWGIEKGKYNAYHSGDITSAPHGACEFIDLDIKSIQYFGIRYIVPSILSYTQQNFCDMPECYMGWMIRTNPGSGEIFEPSTVQNKLDITSESKICIPLIFDLKERKFIWTDIALKSNPNWSGNSVESNEKSIFLVGEAMTSLVKPNLYDLFKMHIEARGEEVDIDEADVIFTTNPPKGTDKMIVTPYDLDIIMSSYL